MKPTIRKAVTAGALWLAAAVFAAAAGDGTVSVSELLVAVAGAPVAGRVVWQVPYYKKPRDQF